MCSNMAKSQASNLLLLLLLVVVRVCKTKLNVSQVEKMAKENSQSIRCSPCRKEQSQPLLVPANEYSFCGKEKQKARRKAYITHIKMEMENISLSAQQTHRLRCLVPYFSTLRHCVFILCDIVSSFRVHLRAQWSTLFPKQRTTRTNKKWIRNTTTKRKTKRTKKNINQTASMLLTALATRTTPTRKRKRTRTKKN